ncbi:helix-turn-helix domain-containing protein [uncultured Draconibacterium sp.]|uniref:helix-turn-helix domain-containing protein n=1 Tax=uncultured Draconibacterium sp. TaxID=1573823 RepID=UPI002AA8CF3D|nr:helix-turn-helix domain-containing protein [uncultured Draconibacterium sp.]
MSSEIVILRKEDFAKFKNELLNEVKELFDKNIKKSKWLRSADVREMLGISDSTLQTFRINKTIPAYKLDSTWFYKYEEIIKALEKGKIR